MPDTAPSQAALEVAKDIRQELMGMAFIDAGDDLCLPAGHLAVMARHIDRFAASRLAELERAEFKARWERDNLAIRLSRAEAVIAAVEALGLSDVIGLKLCADHPVNVRLTDVQINGVLDALAAYRSDTPATKDEA